MNEPLDLIAWAFLVALPINSYFLYHGWALNRSVSPRSPMLRAMLWTKFTVWLVNTYLALVGYRMIANVEPVLPLGGVGLAGVFLFVLTVPAVIHLQMVRLLRQLQHGAADEI